MPHPRRSFEPRARALLATLALFAACAVAAGARAVPLDGSWTQLGIPLRFQGQLLWDGAGQRVVGIGAGAIGAADSIEDAWEFREASGWRRIRLPQPPPELAGLFGLEPDPAGARFLAFKYQDSSTDSIRLCTLELGANPGWRLLDTRSCVPRGARLRSLAPGALWVSAFEWPGPRMMWTRSLADTGLWLLVRQEPSRPTGYIDDVVDADRDRWVYIRRGADSIEVLTSPLSSDGDWVVETTGSPNPPRLDPSMVLPDPARARLLYFVSHPSRPDDRRVWSLELAATPRWVDLGTTDFSFEWLTRAVGSDSVLLHAPRDRDYWAGVGTLAFALANPTHARLLSDPVWPPVSLAGVLVQDAPRGRSLLVGGMKGQFGLGAPLDSLWELRLNGDAVVWRHLPIEGAGPVPEYYYVCAKDESEGTLYLLNGWTYASGSPAGPRELWALRPGPPARWDLVHSAAAGDWPVLDERPVFLFDPLRRRLLAYSYRPGSPALTASAVWELAVDSLPSWRLTLAEGTPPTFFEGGTAAFDAVGARVVMLAENGQIATLETGPTPRWVLGHCLNPADGGCLQVYPYMRGVIDPVGRRLLEMGGFQQFWPHDGLGPAIYELPAGDSLGPARQLEALGSPGNQGAPMLAFDGSRDALLVFGDGSTFGPSLQEFRFDRSNRLVATPRSFAALGDRNTLAWSATPNGTFRLWRFARGGPWTPLADLVASAGGDLAFDDRAVESGVRYGYRLTAAGSPSEPSGADVWIVTATGGAFALTAPWPNPVRGALNVAFTSAVASPAELDLFDVAGRRVWSRRWASPAPGPHHAVIAAGELQRAGLYFLRLRQAGLAATRRVVLAP